MTINNLIIGNRYMCNAIEIQKVLELTDIVDRWLYFKDQKGYVYALSEEHIHLICEIS